MKIKKMNNTLIAWLLKTPLLFAVIAFGCIIGFTALFTIINTLLHINASAFEAYIIVILSAIYPIYYLIKKLPDNKMHRSDFIAITNGCNIITILIPFVFLFIVAPNKRLLVSKFALLYLSNPKLLMLILSLCAIIGLYMIGVASANIYAKYKRAKEIGITPWKIFASMPFAFLLLWTPGYLIPEKKETSDLKIQSKGYKKINQWVLLNSTNTLATFLILLFLTKILSGTTIIILTIVLLVLYALWQLKYKKNFITNINKGYALTAIGINVMLLLIYVVRMLIN